MPFSNWLVRRPTTSGLLALALVVSHHRMLAGDDAVPRELLVRSVREFDEAMGQAGPGDTIALANGEWRDAKLVVRKSGSADRPLIVRAQTSGKARITGHSSLRIGGEHVQVSGFWFDDCEPEGGELISFRSDSKHHAKNCSLSHTLVTEPSTPSRAGERKKEAKWVSIYGVANLVERCEFTGKTSPGALLVVWLPDAAKATPAPAVNHRIVRNLFGPRPRLGKNGGETIRVGDSAHAEQTAGCLIAENRFEQCDGEAECISNKSCGNTYRGNTFVECQGTLTLRHGHECLVERNVFLGNRRKETGGIRVIGERHRVVGNYLVGIQGDDARAALCLMNGQENGPASGYAPVRDCLVADNTLLDCRHSIVLGYSDKDTSAKVPPARCTFQGNDVRYEEAAVIDWRDADSEVEWRDNVMWGIPPTGRSIPGIQWNTIRMKRQVPPVVERVDVGPNWHHASAPSETK